MEFDNLHLLPRRDIEHSLQFSPRILVLSEKWQLIDAPLLRLPAEQLESAHILYLGISTWDGIRE